MAERPSNTPPPWASGPSGPTDPGQGGTPRQPIGPARPAARPLDRPAGPPLRPEQADQPRPASNSPGPALAALTALTSLVGLLEHEPAVGLAIVDAQGRTLACNRRFTALTVPPGPADGDAKAAASPRKGVWARVGAEAVRTAATRRHAAVLHFIHEGRQVQCDVWPLPDAGFGQGREFPGESLFLVLAVEGRFDPQGHEVAVGQAEAKPTSMPPADQRFTTLAPMLAELGALSALTARELEVLAFIGQGMATREIADVLGRSPRTVERHCDAIHKKLGTSNRVQMAKYAMQAGLTPEAGKLKRV